ncbi:MAG TPA: WG repeat-containing protein [Puia sp.]|nr:WG repeat-containing protein [Puia sp.]
MKYLVPLTFIFLLGSEEVRAFGSASVCLFPVKNGAKWGFMDINDHLVIPCTFDSTLGFSEGLAAVESNNEWGFIDNTGKLIVRPQYFHIESFSCGLAQVWTKDRKYPTSFIDTTGKVVFRCKYPDVTSFYCQRARVFIHKKVCYFNRRGKIVLRTSFPYGGVFHEGIAQVWAAHSAEFIDTNGNRIAFFYEMGHEDFSEGTASVLGQEHSFYINRAGEGIRVPGMSFYMDTLGNPTIINTIDSLVYFPFSDGMAEVCLPGTDHKSGFIDSTGKLIIPVIYDHVTPFNRGYASVIRAGKTYIIDKKGNDAGEEGPSAFYCKKCSCK